MLMSALLAQNDDTDKERPNHYTSWTLLDYETRYIDLERKCLAIVYACQKLRHYLINVEANVIVKFDPLKHPFSQTDLSGHFAK